MQRKRDAGQYDLIRVCVCVQRAVLLGVCFSREHCPNRYRVEIVFPVLYCTCLVGVVFCRARQKALITIPLFTPLRGVLAVVEERWFRFR